MYFFYFYCYLINGWIDFLVEVECLFRVGFRQFGGRESSNVIPPGINKDGSREESEVAGFFVFSQ